MSSRRFAPRCMQSQLHADQPVCCKPAFGSGLPVINPKRQLVILTGCPQFYVHRLCN